MYYIKNTLEACKTSISEFLKPVHKITRHLDKTSSKVSIMQDRSSIYRVLLDLRKEFEVVDVSILPDSEKNRYILEKYGNRVVPFFNSEYHSCIVRTYSEKTAISVARLLARYR